MEQPQKNLPVKFNARNLSWRGFIAIVFCLSMLSYSYSEMTKTNVPATQAEIDEVLAAAKVDKRPHIADKLEQELSKTPNPKVWQLNRIKYKLGLTYVDSESYKENLELKKLQKKIKESTE